MIYPITQLLAGHSLKETYILWKTKLRLFNPKTYELLRYIKWFIILQYEKFLSLINKKTSKN